jgi:hypothetical protein
MFRRRVRFINFSSSSSDMGYKHNNLKNLLRKPEDPVRSGIAGSCQFPWLSIVIEVDARGA